MRAWHLKASYEVFGADGQSKDKGTFEEWWIKDKEYKVAYSSPGLSLEAYGNGHGTFVTGAENRLGRPLALIQPMIEEPVPSPIRLEDVGMKNFERDFGHLKLWCTGLGSHGDKGITEKSTSYCFAPKEAALLYSSSPDQVFQTLFQNVSVFHGRCVAHDLRVLILGAPWLTVHIDSMEDMDPSEVQVAAVPAGAREVTPHAMAPGEIAGGHLIKRVTPQYPSSAKMQGVQGMVILDATIGRDGRIQKLEVLGGPQALQQPALDAVRQWVYKPFVVDGQVVEIQTEIHVVFRLGG